MPGETGENPGRSEAVELPPSGPAAWVGRPVFLAVVLVFFFTSHLYRITDPPNGYHRWRETDTVAVARNFATESWNFLRPRVDARGDTDGVVGMELPVYSWSVAAASRIGWDLHGWARLITVLGACLALFSFHRVVCRLTGRPDLAGLATLLAACAPLVAFYGRKMQPDVWGLAFALSGLALFVEWTLGGRWALGVAAAALTALGGCIKPTFLALGLPMLVFLFRQRGRSFLADWRVWLFAAGCLLPVAVWFRYARGLNAAGPSYYYLGGNWSEIAESILSSRFYRNVFRTWLFELVIGTPVIWAFLLGLVQLRGVRNAGVVVAWILGTYATFFLTAKHCATAHDYYNLPAVFPLAVLTAVGLRAALGSSRRWAQALAVVAALSMPVYGFARMSARFGEPYDLWEGRARAAEHLSEDALVITMERTPCFLHYYSGHRGWSVPPGSDAAVLEAAARAGGRFLLVERSQHYDLTAYREILGTELYSDDWLVAYPIRPSSTGDRPEG